MANLFFISDTHFGHANIINFKRNDGTPLRPFSSIQEHDEFIVEHWNRLVRPQDHIYHLGDVCVKSDQLGILKRCNGHKRLVRGNHDIFKTRMYMNYFEEIYGVRIFVEHGFACSHIPLHPDSLNRRGWSVNVHGHTHANRVLLNEKPDPRYIPISCEHTAYMPVSLEEIKKLLESQKTA